MEQYFRKTILYNKDTTGKNLSKPRLERNFLNLYPFSIRGEVLANAVRKGIKGLQTGKEEIKLSLFEDMIIKEEKETPYPTFSFSFVCRKRVRLWSCSVSTPSSWEYWRIFSRSCCRVSATMLASLTLK